MRQYFFFLVSCSIFSVVLPQKTLAWGELSHSTIGYIAEKKLTAKAKGLVYQITGTEPLAVSGPWPDKVRSDERHNVMAPYHYLTVPYGYAYETLPPNMRAEKDSEALLANAPQLLASSSLSREQKMILLRYIVHVVGDVHQPLHVGNGLDNGGNLCDVYFQDPDSNKWILVSLHSAWDDYIVKNVSHEYVNQPGPTPPSKRWFGYKEFGEMILQDKTLNVEYDEVVKTKRTDWYEESRKLHPQVYPETQLDKTGTVDVESHAYCKKFDKTLGKVVDGKYDAAKLPKLNESYIKRAIIISKTRILTAGYRLAHLLNLAAHDSKAPEWTPQLDKEILEPILFKNKL